MRNETTIFVVDDDDVVRKSLALSLTTRGLKVVSYRSAEDFLKSYQPVENACLVLDVRLGGMSGLELQEALKVKHVSIPIIFITGHGDIPMSVQAIRRGAIDFLEKPFATTVLLSRIEEALAEHALTNATRIEQEEAQSLFESLTKREREVLAHLLEDPAATSNKGTATKLGVSHRTIEHHRASIMKKMQAHSIVDLVSIMRTHGPFVEKN